jgi:hypothetical protein
MVQNDGKGGYRPVNMSTRILIVVNEPDVNAALLGALEQSGFKADSSEYPPIALENFESHL